jgi:hypothetical protein
LHKQSLFLIRPYDEENEFQDKPFDVMKNFNTKLRRNNNFRAWHQQLRKTIAKCLVRENGKRYKGLQICTFQGADL